MSPLKTVRVATYNIYLGCDLSLVFGVTDDAELAKRVAVMRAQLDVTDLPARAAAIAAVLARERVDVVGLQEVATWTRTAAGATDPVVVHDFLELLLGALARAGSPYDAWAVTPNFNGGAVLADGESMAVLGANVILVRRDAGLSVVDERAGAFSAALRIDTSGAGVSVDARRSWGAVDLALGDRTLHVVNTHLEAWDAGARSAQCEELLAAIGERGVPVVVLGDFNAPPSEVAMPREYVDAWAVAGDGDGHTYGQGVELVNAESGMHERIDYVFVRAAAVTAARVVGDQQSDRTPAARLWPSDHACVIADVELSTGG